MQILEDWKSARKRTKRIDQRLIGRRRTSIGGVHVQDWLGSHDIDTQRANEKDRSEIQNVLEKMGFSK